jgi:hypothetical protein
VNRCPAGRGMHAFHKNFRDKAARTAIDIGCRLPSLALPTSQPAAQSVLGPSYLALHALTAY